ncbi:MAG TPA: hopanoid-associated sugar epimerase [Bryobacteraceae bacterium]|jgi:dihydroflavonol-4-reductase|nr:hopanoid-associated sugar epimerase [Bryobacteraceae bacterium]
MKPALVTGASGFLGWHVARVLLEHGYPVRALVRPGSRVDGLDVETVTGDLRDAASLERAVAGCGLVFHVAADYRLWAADPRDLYRSNVDGTHNLLEAAHTARVERIVYTSTVGCIGIPHDGIGDEDTPVSLAEMTGDYKRSKYLAEGVALEYARDGLPVVIVNPTAPIGDHDVKPTPTGKIVVDFLNGDMPAFIDTGLNVVDVRDTAEGHWLACERGKVGERYILGSENLTLAQILQKLARITGRKAPTMRLPYAVAYCAGACSTAWANVTGTPPRVPLSGVRMARKKMWVTHEKARRELGFNPGPAEVALTRAVEWFRRQGSGSGRRPAQSTAA